MDLRQELNKLSKDELIELFFKRCFFMTITQRDIDSIRWQSLSDKGLALLDEAVAEKKGLSPRKDFEKWVAAEKKYRKSQRILDRADRLYKKMYPETKKEI